MNKNSNWTVHFDDFGNHFAVVVDFVDVGVVDIAAAVVVVGIVVVAAGVVVVDTVVDKVAVVGVVDTVVDDFAVDKIAAAAAGTDSSQKAAVEVD